MIFFLKMFFFCFFVISIFIMHLNDGLVEISPVGL